MKTLLLIMLLGLITIEGYPQDIESMLKDVANASKEIQNLNIQIIDVKQRAQIAVNKKKYHNDHPCTFPEGHPEYCKDYENEKIELDNKCKEILNEWDKYEAQLKELNSKLSSLMPQIRKNKSLSNCNCNGKTTIEEVQCYQSCFDQLNDNKVIGFTGTRVYHLAAKSWINNDAVSEFSFNGFYVKKIDWTSTTEPTSSILNPNINDYKLYQSFNVLVEFDKGIVVSAKFIQPSLDFRAGKTNSVPGEANLKEQKISALGGSSVIFTRTVTGHSYLLTLKETVLGTSSPDIYNTISIEVFADKVVKHGYASDFPTTYFWIDNNLFEKKLQVQPADFFKQK